MRRLALATLVIAIVSSFGIAAADTCDEDPSCANGRGHVSGHACWRNEASPLAGGAGNGRVCVEHPQGGDDYVYTRGLGNREPVVVCRDGRRVYPPPSGPDPDGVCGRL